MEKISKETELKIIYSTCIFAFISLCFWAYFENQNQLKLLEQNKLFDLRLSKTELEQKYSVVFGEVMVNKDRSRLGVKTIDVYPATSPLESNWQSQICAYRMFKLRGELKRPFVCIEAKELTNPKYFEPKTSKPE
jgi:hypothetical protein